jgi:hypothetical protein
MVNFDQLDKRIYELNVTGADNKVFNTTLNLLPHSISNKFECVVELIEYMIENIEGFDEWYSELLIEYGHTLNAEILIENAPTLVAFSKEYIDSLNLDLNRYVNVSKKSSSSILFTAEDIRELFIASAALKLYALFMCSKEWRLPENSHKRVYDELIRDCTNLNVNKIFQLVRSRTYRSSMTDRYMWDFIKLVISETPESYLMLVFNFIMTNIISLLEVNQNPIPYIIATVDRSIGWMMRTVYKDKTIYGEIYGNVDDVYGSSLTTENFYFYCCNDVISKAANIGMQLLEDENFEDFEEVKFRLENVNTLFPPAKLVTLPLVSEVLEIPYRQLVTVSPKHATLLGVFMYKLATDVGLTERFPIVTDFMGCVPSSDKAFSLKSSYNIRNLEFILNDHKRIFGFGSPILKFKILRQINGALSASKRNLIYLNSGRQMGRLTHLDLENDVCVFFTEFYSKNLDPTILKMREVADSYF